MSYPQPDADLYAINGYSFFRLNTTLTTDGDIYQSAQGTHAFALGPDSDISRVAIGYFDKQVDRYMDQFMLTADRPFLGSIAAQNDAQYAPSNVPGRVLFWPDELYNPTWRPTDWDTAEVRVDFVAPVIDIIQYFSPVPVNNGQRNNKAYHYDRLPFSNTIEFYYLVIPFYGRRYASIKFGNQIPGVNISGLDVYGLNYRPTSNPTGAPEDSGRLMETVPSSGVINSGSFYATVIKASTYGMFDALAIRIIPGVPTLSVASKISLDIITSDREDG
jgi:hypothetical protein